MGESVRGQRLDAAGPCGGAPRGTAVSRRHTILRSREIQDALRDAGAVLIRSHKHLVYRLPNGAIITMANTPGDRRADQNTLRDLRRALKGGQ